LSPVWDTKKYQKTLLFAIKNDPSSIQMIHTIQSTKKGVNPFEVTPYYIWWSWGGSNPWPLKCHSA